MNWKLKLVDDWREFHKWAEVQLGALAALAAMAYQYLPAAKDYLPDGWVKWAFIVIIAARLIERKAVASEGDQQ